MNAGAPFQVEVTGDDAGPALFCEAMRTRRIFWGALFAALVLTQQTADAGPKRPVVVELFTSQSCNTCPPADAFLGRLAERKDVLAMTLPITYWDMLGWKDTFGTEENTHRQKAYAAAMGRGGVYTPQIVVDGVSDAVGSREAAVDAAIAAREADMTAIPLELRATQAEIHISVGQSDANGTADATIWLFRILTKASVNVRAGENSGRLLSYRNIVRDVRAVGQWKGQPVSLDLPRTLVAANPHDAIAIVVQQGGYGRILGAELIGGTDYPPPR